MSRNNNGIESKSESNHGELTHIAVQFFDLIITCTIDFIAQFNTFNLFPDGISKLTFVEYEIPVPWGVVTGELQMSHNRIANTLIQRYVKLYFRQMVGLPTKATDLMSSRLAR